MNPLLLLMAAQVPEPAKGLPYVDDLVQGGPYAVVALLLLVARSLYAELKEERRERLADRDRHDKEKQELNDKVLAVSQQTTTAVLQNTEVQRQLVDAIAQAKGTED